MDIFHILNRGVEKKNIFLNEKDYFRFTYNLYDFNNINNTDQSYYYRRRSELAEGGANGFSDVARRKRRKKELVDVLCWCLMPNHPHVMVAEKLGGGVSVFSKKIIGGYTKYFNDKNERVGVLFQGRSKIILIKDPAHFLYLSFYIHSNPLKLFQPDWKENGLREKKKAIDFLRNYRWSSYRGIIGSDGFSKIINRDLFFELFDTNEEKYQKDFEEWLLTYRFISDVRRRKI